LCAWWKLILTLMNISGGWRLQDELVQPAAVTSAVRECAALLKDRPRFQRLNPLHHTAYYT